MQAAVIEHDREALLAQIPDVELLRAERARRRLHDYVRWAWSKVDPAAFIDNWHIGAMCEHLEAVTRGQIQKLLITEPPRHQKSLTTCVFWPTWEWIDGPEEQFIFTSYRQDLAIRDAVKSRRLIQHDAYQAAWGDRYQLAGDVNLKHRYENNRQGHRVSVGFGSALGENATRVVCFPAEQEINTERGPIPIGEIVRRRMQISVPAFDGASVSTRRVIGWHENPGSRLLRVLTSGGTLVCTPDHRILTPSGWIAAAELHAGALLSAIGPDEIASCSRPASASPDRVDVTALDAVQAGQPARRLGRAEDSSNIFAHEQRPRFSIPGIAIMFDPVSDVLRTRPVGDILAAVVQWVAVEMAHFMACRGRTDEGNCYQLVDSYMDRSPFGAQDHSSVALRRRGLENPARDASAVRPRSWQATDTSERGNFVSRKPADRPPFLRRVVAVEDAGFAGLTYCITVEHAGTFSVVGPNAIVANCDDPHNMEEAHSKPIRESDVETWNSTLSMRRNNPRRDALVIIMQRLHEGDLAGAVLRQGGWVHLKIPAEYAGRRVISIGPGNLGTLDPREAKGELICPARIGPAEIAEMKTTLGSYGVSAQLQQEPSPEEGGIIKKAWFRLWPAGVPLPPIEHLLLVYDTAYTEDTLNDPTACVCLGVIREPKHKRRVAILFDAWSEHLAWPALRRRLAEDWRARYGGNPKDPADPGKRPDALVIESKATGVSLIQDLNTEGIPAIAARRIYGTRYELDKVARASNVAPIIEAGGFWLLESEARPGEPRSWAASVRDQLCSLPKGERDDEADAAVHGLTYLKLEGWLEAPLATAPRMPEKQADALAAYATQKRQQEPRNPYSV